MQSDVQLISASVVIDSTSELKSPSSRNLPTPVMNVDTDNSFRDLTFSMSKYPFHRFFRFYISGGHFSSETFSPSVEIQLVCLSLVRLIFRSRIALVALQLGVEQRESLLK